VRTHRTAKSSPDYAAFMEAAAATAQCTDSALPSLAVNGWPHAIVGRARHVMVHTVGLFKTNKISVHFTVDVDFTGSRIGFEYSKWR
jgi:hypothetical protein